MESNQNAGVERTENLMMEMYNSIEIGDKFLNREFTANEKNILKAGKTIHWKNMDIGGEHKRDINVKMQTFINEKGNMEKGISVQVKTSKLSIPDKIMELLQYFS